MDVRTEVYHSAVGARDQRFDGLFFVGITSTRVYCRPVCPARLAYPHRRRFFSSAAAAEQAGFRPCLRCRPELAPGRALCDAVSRLAGIAAKRIAAGWLNGRGVADLARDLSVSERHLRRAVERELGVSPLELAQTHRLLLAKQLLSDTKLSVTRIAFASGFQSLRRFNSVFRERYRMPPSALRRSQRVSSVADPCPASDVVRLTLSYRTPFAWTDVIRQLGHAPLPQTETFAEQHYARNVALGGHKGMVLVQRATQPEVAKEGEAAGVGVRHLRMDVSSALVPVLMPLFARLRQLLDLDSEPSVVDAHLAARGLAEFVRCRPGLRLAGALDGFEVVLRFLLRDGRGSDLARRVCVELGEPLDLGVAALRVLPPSAERVADAGPTVLSRLGVSQPRARAISGVARLVADGALRLEPGQDADACERMLSTIQGIDAALASRIVMHALGWPDTFPASDPTLQRAAGVTNESALRALADHWRPWRSYAALHLLHEGTSRREPERRAL